ncbi:hypothetical protein DASC09_057090 [Saccharomycopsis crataegensis]|uniref:Uncharacterized protein n=1 Tax=Saccharomycopsis crataegensis TaxID=43959 RepID=A0AAV5QUU8_9ASCO|nr:hypothetical protein DASC09_057090 [Saccharomycopsis crataegensis]
MKRGFFLIFCLWLITIASALHHIPITEAPVATDIAKRESAEEKSEKSASKASEASIKSVSKASKASVKSASKASKSAASIASKAFESASKAAKAASISASKASQSLAKASSKSSVNSVKYASKVSVNSVKSASKASASASKARVKASESMSKNIASKSKVYASMEKKVTRTASAVVDQSEITTDSAYVDIYDCGTDFSDITSPAQISKAKYGCRYSAWVGYYLNQGQAALTNLTYLMNEYSTYEENYKAYIKAIQNSIMSDFGEWLHEDSYKNLNYYKCKNSRSTTSCIHENIVGKASICTGGTFSNMHIPDSQKAAAAASLSTYYNATIKASDLTLMDSSTTFQLAENVLACKFTAKNMTLPSAALLDNDPIASFTWDNLTNLASLLATAKGSVGKVSPIDLIDFLTPVPVFTNMAQRAMYIDAQGAEQIKIEKEERKLAILNIIFTIVGVAAIFADGLAAVALDSVLAGVQVLATWSITGEVSPVDIISTIAGAVGGIFSAIKLGRNFSEVVNTLRFSATSDLTKQMLKMPDYQECVQAAYGVAMSTS